MYEINENYNPIIIRIQTLNERGFYRYLMERTPSLIAGIVHGTSGSSPSLLEKISSHIEVQESSVGDIGWKHFQDVTYVLIAGLIVSSSILMIERIWIEIQMFERRKKRLKRRKIREKERFGHFQLNLSQRNLSILQSLPHPD